MKLKKLLIPLFCLVFAFGLAACGGGGSASGEGEEAQDPGDVHSVTVEVAGEEFTSGNLTVTVPEGWEVASDDNNWEEGSIKLLETANIDPDSTSFVHGEVYVDIDLSSYSTLESTYNEEARNKEAEEKGDDNAKVFDWTYNDNVWKGFRQYTYVGDSAEDWAYSAYGKDGSILEIRAFTDADFANDTNREAIQVILASIKIDGEPVGIEAPAK